jgi:hypothetical protein
MFLLPSPSSFRVDFLSLLYFSPDLHANNSTSPKIVRSGTGKLISPEPELEPMTPLLAVAEDR